MRIGGILAGRNSGIGKLVTSLFLVWSCYAPLTGLQAQPVRKPIRVLTTKDGLPQSFVSGLIQDADGLVWVGTRNGLARYDGRQFTVFHHRQGDTSTLSSDVIISLASDTHGHIWIEHESGEIDRLNPHTQHIEPISQRALMGRQPMHFARRGWTIDPQGNLWGTQLTGGVWCYDWAHQTIRHYTPQRHGLPNDTIRGVLASRRGNRIWLLGQTALRQLNPATGQLRTVRLPQAINVDYLPARAGGTIQLHERSNGEIMWAYHHQLLVFDPVTNRIRQFPLPSVSATYLCWFYTGPNGQDYGMAFNRVYRYDPTRGPVVLGELEPASLGSESLLVDQSGLIWVGTDAAGIHLIDPAGPSLAVYPNQLSFQADLFQQEFGVSLTKSFGWSLSKGVLGPLSYNLRSAYDVRNRLWVALRYQAGYLDEAQQRFVLLPPIPTAKPTTDNRLGISGLHVDPDGRVWTVDNDGHVAVFDTLRRSWTRWLSADQLRQVVAPRIVPQDIVADRQAIWITDHQHGLIRIERATKQVTVINQATPLAQLPSNLLLGLQPDPTRSTILWIGSHAGLICFDKTRLRGQVFTTDNGLPDNTIYSVVADDRGYLWLSTNKGLCRFHPITRQVRVLSTIDGLLGDEFNRFHHLRLPDGRLAFGGPDGWTILDPGTIQNDHFQPMVALTDLKINNQPVSITPGKGLLPAPLNSLSELVVPYRQNTISVSFAGLQYAQPAKLRYRYQLTGYDADWVGAGGSPVATYTQLPPGHYGLRVNATNTTGQWSRHVHTLSITVTPPWWRTNLAYLLYILSGIGLLRLYVRYRTQRDRNAQRQLAQQREAEQLRIVDEMKTRFFANITHEFRTPLTLILSPAEALLRELSQSQYGNRLALIERNAQQLLGLINQLMELARLDANLMTVTVVRGRPDEVVNGIVHTFAEAARANHIALAYQAEGIHTYWFDADKLERIVTNLVANALKFTPGTPASPGTVTVTLRTDVGSGLQLRVADTGIGIAAGQLPHLFNRFYQANTRTSHQSPGTGIGLALVKELVDLQNGQIRVESQPGRGTTFWVELPYLPALGSQPLAPPPNEFPPSGGFTALHEPETALVLLVEDNDDMAQFITQSLPASYQVHRAVDGLDGLEQAREAMPDLIISDVMMPRLDGFALCEYLKTDARTDHIPVILLTAKVSLDNRMQGLRLGADDYVDKPFHLPELLLRVNNLLTTQRRRGERIRADLQLPVAASAPEPPHPFLDKLYQIVQQHLDDATFGGEELASQAGLSRMQLYRKLKALTGLSATDFIRTYRLKQSVALLQQGFSVSQTAYAVGFESPSYFGQCFREQFGEPPSRFAKNARE
ncbi:ATP-binding protein [Spirosoma validum]|uniref:histidine kinase n=1 Tax=Spirosoma validum TaxID=2771355 RepID=A0A927B9G8_9BACT|nr:ATP-binding protein [Spirosoma validum]MBD2757683.1 response regulator [Spirosoma validum]